MAARYWVGNGDWDSSNTANWSASSTGTPTGASVPTVADDVIFSAISGSCNVTTFVQCLTFTMGSGFVGSLFAPSYNLHYIGVNGTTGTVITMTPGAAAIVACGVYPIAASGSVSINVNLSTNIPAGYTLSMYCGTPGGTATFTLLTNGNFYNTTTQGTMSVYHQGGTFSTGTVNPTFGAFSGYEGTVNFNASTVTAYNGINIYPSTGPVTIALGTSVINATGGASFISLGNPGGPTGTTITAGATQTLNSTQIGIYPTAAGTTTLRTITASSSLTIAPVPGTNVTVGVVTCNGQGFLQQSSGAGVTSVITATSWTGSSGSGQVSLTVNTVGFSCGAITLSTTAGSGIDAFYYEQSAATVNVTGTLTVTSDQFMGNVVQIASVAGTGTVTYAGISAPSNATYGRSAVTFGNARAVTAGAITAGRLGVTGAGNVTVGAVTLGSVVSAVTYNGQFDSTGTGNFQATSFAAGASVVIETFRANGQGTGATFNVTGAIAAIEFWVRNYTTSITVGGNITITNNIGAFNTYLSITGCPSVSLAGYAVTGTAYGSSNFVEMGTSSEPIGNLTISGVFTLGTVAANRLPVTFYATGAVNFSNASATHVVAQFNATRLGSLTFASGSTLQISYGAASEFLNANPIYIVDSATTSISFRALTCDYTNSDRFFVIATPAAAVTFNNSPTMGATAATRCGLDVTATTLSCPAIETTRYVAILSGALTQSGQITVAQPTIPVSSRNNIVDILVGATSSIASISLSPITDTGDVYGVVLNCTSGTLSIGNGFTGSLAAVGTRVSLGSNGVSSAFSIGGGISSISEFVWFSGNLTLVSSIGVNLRYRWSVESSSAGTLTPNTSVITIDGTSTYSGYPSSTAIFNHGGKTYNNIIFSNTAQKQYVQDTTVGASSVTLSSLVSNGAAVVNSFLSIGTNITATLVGPGFQALPNSATNRHLVCSNNAGTPRTISANATSFLSGIDFADITAAGASAPWNVSSSSAGNAGGNTNITFPAAVTRTLVASGTVNWNSTAAWGGSSAPLAHDTVLLSGSSATVSTNGATYLGNVSFGNFAGNITVTVSNAAIAIPPAAPVIDLSSMIGSFTGLPFAFISRTATTFSPPALASSFSSVLDKIAFISTGTLTMAGANDFRANATNVGIYGTTINTDTGTRICNFDFTGAPVFSYINLTPPSSPFNVGPAVYYSPLTNVTNVNSSTLNAGGTNSYLHCYNVTGTTPTFLGTNVACDGNLTLTNATITLVDYFDYGGYYLGTASLGSSTFNLDRLFWSGAGSIVNPGSAVFNLKSVCEIQSDNWTASTEQINIRPTGSSVSLQIGSLFPSPSTVNSILIDDVNSTSPLTTQLSMSLDMRGTANTFNLSAMRRNMLMSSSLMNIVGGLSSSFSNKGWMYFDTGTINVSGANPAYLPFVFLRNTNVTAGSVVAYGPANLGSNTGAITYPSRLRYYAFVGTGATTMTVPADYNGMGVFFVAGGGATPSSVASTTSSSGGGSGSTSYHFATPLNNTAAPLQIGQTVYINAGNYAIAPAAGSAGGNGNVSWVNVSANTTPGSNAVGASANGGFSTGSGGAAGVGHLATAGYAAGGGISSRGGGGGASLRFNGALAIAGGIGGGGSGTVSGAISSTGGKGSVAGGAPGTSGTTPTAGGTGPASTGAGGGGGGANTSTNSTTTFTFNTVTRANGSTTLVFNVASHGLATNDRIFATTVGSPLKTGSYSKTSSSAASTATVNIAAHGLVAGDLFYFDRTSGTLIPDGTYTVITATTNSFIFLPNVTGTTSGNCRLGESGVMPSTYYAVTVNNPNQFQITSGVNTILRSGNWSYSYNYARLGFNGANGGSGALNSAEQFIQYYNGVYTPGYFGIGAGGGGGGAAWDSSSTQNRLGYGGSGGAAGIGAGGGGKGGDGAGVSTVFGTSGGLAGQGGPGIVIFIYARRSNNLSLIQGQ